MTSLILSDPPNQGSIVTGCFDPLHTGHQHLLTEALRFGPVCVILMSDNYIRNVKKREPFQNLKTRQEVLMHSCPNPSMFFLMIADTNEQVQDICNRINPTHRVVGNDYSPDQVIKNRDSLIVIVPRVGGYSSTSLRNN